MRLFLCSLVVFFATTTVAWAYEITITDPVEPYATISLPTYQANDARLYLGALDQYPVMYEFSVTGEMPFIARLRQRYAPPEPTAFSLILVRVSADGRGIKEVARLRPQASEWTRVKDTDLGLTFWEAPTFEHTLATGTYRLEVSAPDNESRYALAVGQGESDAGYFKTVTNIRTTQAFFGYSIVKLLTSPYVYVPLGIVLLLVGGGQIWRQRNRIRHVE